MNLACEESLEEGEWAIPIEYPQPIGVCDMWT